MAGKVCDATVYTLKPDFSQLSFEVLMRVHHQIIAIAVFSALVSGAALATEEQHNSRKSEAAKASLALNHSTKSIARISAAKSEKKGKVEKRTPAKRRAATAKNRTPQTVEDIERKILALPAELRPIAFTRMLMLSSLATPTLIADSQTSGRLAARYSEGVALTRLSGVLKAARLSAAARCADKFAQVYKDLTKSLVNSSPSGCAGFREINSDAVDLDAKKEDLLFRWATLALQQGMAGAKAAGLPFQARPSQISLAEAYK